MKHTGNLASQKHVLLLADGTSKRKLGKPQRLQLNKVLVLSEVLCELPPHFCSQPCQYKTIQCNTSHGPEEKFA